jgi:UDP-N-acetyl-alpha-D-muramoyl-L-alanyl-L-glutamate epimerase
LLSVLDGGQWSGLPLVEEFRSRRGELAMVAAGNDESGPAVNYVPARYAATLAFAELPG